MDLNIDFGQPAKGKLLISEPFLPDPSFKRTVVLLTEHNEQGSVGFVLNRPLDIPINEAVLNFPHFDALLSAGGPVQPDTLHYIHTMGKSLEKSIEVIDGLFWGGDFESMKALIISGKATPEDFKFFVGYSGWSAGQLDDEMKSRSWIVADATLDNVFHMDPENLWRSILKNMGTKYSVISNFPEDPSFN